MANSGGRHQVRTIDEAITWIANHGGEIDEKWRHQDLLNKQHAETTEKIFDRIDALTTRIAWMTGAAVALGAVLSLAAQAWNGR